MTITSLPRAEVRYNTAANNPIKFGPFTLDGVAITASATATIAISNPAGTAIVTATSMTAALPYFTYSVNTSSTTSYPLDEGYIADIIVTHSTNTYNYRVFFDVVRQPFYFAISDTDLQAYMPDVSGRLGSLSNFSSTIKMVGEEIKAAIIARGFRPALVFDPASFRPAHCLLTLAALCHGYFQKQTDDSWAQVGDRFYERGEAALLRALETVTMRYDENEDGKLGDGEKHTTSPVRLLL